ncbi:MAG: hypothetical protein CMI26_13245 [Opitutae bacterium]|nr:hypothetical protein [Opitutae bacterium]
MKIRILSILSLITFSGGHLSAGPLELGKVSAQANWMVHVDFESLLKTDVGQFLLAEIKKQPNARRQLAGIKAAFGVDIDGLGNLTAYGRGENEKGIAIASGGFNAKQLEGFIALNEEIEASNHAGKTIYSENEKAFAIIGEDTIVAGTGADYVKHGIDVMDGKEPSRDTDKILNELAKAIPYPVAQGIADLKGIMKFNPPMKAPEAAMLKKASAIGLSVGEVDGEVRVAAVMKTADESTAGHLENVLRGAASLMTLGSDLDPKVAELASAIKTHVSREGSHVRIYLGVSADLVKEEMAKEMAKKKVQEGNDSIDAGEK